MSKFSNSYLISEAERLFIKKSDPEFKVPVGSEVAVLKGLETAKQLLAWRELYGEKVTEWLSKNV